MGGVSKTGTSERDGSGEEPSFGSPGDYLQAEAGFTWLVVEVTQLDSGSSSNLQPLPKHAVCPHGSCQMGAWVLSRQVSIYLHHLAPSRLTGARPLR